MHAMRGISTHSNGFHTCHALHNLQILPGSIDVPGGFRYKAPFPKHIPAPDIPANDPDKPNTPLGGMPLGFPTTLTTVSLVSEPGGRRNRSGLSELMHHFKKAIAAVDNGSGSDPAH